MIRYEIPKDWIRYDGRALVNELAQAKAAVLSLQTIPYQKAWVETLQQVELKREVAGTSKIEGAEFTDRELEVALKETPEQLLTRSQRQAHAAVNTYRWIAKLPDDRPLNDDLILSIHRRIVTNADDDHCPPGQLRKRDDNVNFGTPRHRGAEGGEECERAFIPFTAALQHEYGDHDPILQALAAHYHLAAMHPFLDGNGRTARALEALMLQRAGLRNTAFVAMSNYYYDEKTQYLSALAETRQRDHDLTPFMLFGLKGITAQSQRLLGEIQHKISKELFRNLMWTLYGRLRTPRKRVIVERQIKTLNLLLEVESMELDQVIEKTGGIYGSLKNPRRALIRDLNGLIDLNAIHAKKLPNNRWEISVRLAWPTEFTDTAAFDRLIQLPKAQSPPFLQ